jgi:DNA-binding transcriptional LysR family regulator
MLEDAVGIPLFTRDRNNIQLTSAGLRLLGHAETVVSTWSRTLQDVAVAQDDQIMLVIGGMPSMWDIILGEWISLIYENKPELVINAEMYSYNQLLVHLIDRTVDLGFMFDYPNHSDLEVIELGAINIIMVSTEANMSVAEALQGQYVYVDWGTSFAVSHARAFPDLPPTRLRVAQGRMAYDFLLQNGGAAFLAEPMLKEVLNAGRMHLIPGAPSIQRHAYAVFHTRSDRRQNILDALRLLPQKPTLKQVEFNDTAILGR